MKKKVLHFLDRNRNIVEEFVNIMAVDVLAMYDNLVLIFHNEIFQPLVLSQLL